MYQKLKTQTLEGNIYRTLNRELQSKAVQQEIKTQFPKPDIHRRNTGYAIDEIIKTQPFTNSNIALQMNELY